MGKRAVGWYRAHLQPAREAEPCSQTAVREESLPQAIAVGDTVQVDETSPCMKVVSIADGVAVCEWPRRGRHGYELPRAPYDLTLLIKVKKPVKKPPMPTAEVDGLREDATSTEMIRSDYSASQLRRLAARSRHPNQSRRLRLLAALLDGMSCDEAASVGGVHRQTIPNWVHRCNANSPDGISEGPRNSAPAETST